ncbi:MAG: hypothetical protein K0B10_10640 [Vicingaceae bacterium]|nr:hypothetical protein [Vicingaceae bacterium]
MKKLSLVITLLFLSLLSFSQTKTEFTLTLKDGSIVTGTTKVTKISLSTEYGKLEIPIKNVSSIELGIVADNSLKNTITSLVNQLYDNNEEPRSKAFSSLTALKIGAIPVLEDVIFSLTEEKVAFEDFNAEDALSELKIKYNVGSDYKTKDNVVIDNEYNMGGNYDFSSIELKTEYGTLNIPREKIEKIDVMFIDPSNSNNKTLKLNASTHITSNNNGGWLKTGIIVKANQTITISAKGEIILASLSNNTYKPDGSVKSAGADSFIGNASSSDYPTYGNVVFKIGEKGAATKAGAKYAKKATLSGMLYLSIHETVYNPVNSGSYIVSINVK